MKLIFLLLCSLIFLYSFGQNSDTAKRSGIDSFLHDMEMRKEMLIGKQFDQFSFPLIGKENFTNADLKGRVTFINFWFESCPPCIAEFDALNKLFLKFNADSQFTFVSFTFETPEAIAAVRKKYDLKFPVISIKREECYRLNQQFGFPTNIILNDSSSIKYINSGGQLGSEKVGIYFNTIIYPKISKELEKLNYTKQNSSPSNKPKSLSFK